MLKRIQNNELLSSSIVYTIGNFLIKGIGFFTLPIFIRITTQSEYGMINNFTSLVAIFSVFVGLSMNSSINNANFEFKEKIRDYLSSITFLSLIIFTFFLVLGNVCFVFSNLYFGLNQLLFNLMIVQSYGFFIVSILQSYYTINVEKIKFLILSLVSTIGSIILSLVFMISFLDYDKYLGRTLGGTVWMFIISVFLLYNIFSKGKSRINKAYWRYALTLSIPIVPHVLSGVLLGQFDRVMINNMLLPKDTAIYSFVANVALILNIIYTSLNTAWVPWFYRKMSESKELEVHQKVEIYTAIFLVLTVGFMNASIDVSKILGSKDYFSGLSLLLPLSLGFFFQFLYSFPVNLEFYLKKNGIIAAGTVISAGLNIVLNLIFIPKYGVMAAAYNTTVTYFILFVSHYIVSMKISNIRIFSLKDFSLPLLIVMIYTVGMHAVFDNVLYRYFLMIITIITIVFIYKKKAFKIVMGISKNSI